MAQSAATVLCVTGSCLCWNCINMVLYSTGLHRLIVSRKHLGSSVIFDLIYILENAANATSDIFLIIAVSCRKEAHISTNHECWNVKVILSLFIAWNVLAICLNYVTSCAEAIVLDIRLPGKVDPSRWNGSALANITREDLRHLGGVGIRSDLRPLEPTTRCLSCRTNTLPKSDPRAQVTLTCADALQTPLYGYLIFLYTVSTIVKAIILYRVYYHYLRLILEDILVPAYGPSQEQSTLSQQDLEPPWEFRALKYHKRSTSCSQKKLEVDDPPPSMPAPRPGEEVANVALTRPLEDWFEHGSRRGSMSRGSPLNVFPVASTVSIWTGGDKKQEQGEQCESLEALQQRICIRRSSPTASRSNRKKREVTERGKRVQPGHDRMVLESPLQSADEGTDSSHDALPRDNVYGM